MSAPFQPGDVVVCVDDAREALPGARWSRTPVRKGGIYRVLWCRQSAFPGVYAVRLTSDTADENAGWRHTRFRPIDADVTEDFREQLRKLPVRERAA